MQQHFLGIEPRQVLYLIRRGKLPATKLGWVWVIKQSDLEAFRRG